MHVPFAVGERDTKNLTSIKCYFSSLVFAQDLLKLIDSRIRANCQEMGSFESNKRSHLTYFNEQTT